MENVDQKKPQPNADEFYFQQLGINLKRMKAKRLMLEADAAEARLAIWQPSEGSSRASLLEEQIQDPCTTCPLPGKVASQIY